MTISITKLIILILYGFFSLFFCYFPTNDTEPVNPGRKWLTGITIVFLLLTFSHEIGSVFGLIHFSE
jgi:hypothetical protein